LPFRPEKDTNLDLSQSSRR